MVRRRVGRHSVAECIRSLGVWCTWWIVASRCSDLWKDERATVSGVSALGVRYWTVLDEDLVVVPEADAFLRHLRLGRDCSELTTRSYAGGVALFLGWCAGSGRH